MAHSWLRWFDCNGHNEGRRRNRANPSSNKKGAISKALHDGVGNKPLKSDARLIVSEYHLWRRSRIIERTLKIPPEWDEEFFNINLVSDVMQDLLLFRIRTQNFFPFSDMSVNFSGYKAFWISKQDIFSRGFS